MVEAILDIGGAQSQIYRGSIKQWGLQLDVIVEDQSYGTFFGPGWKYTRYYRRVPGAVFLWFDDLVELYLPKLMVIEHHGILLFLGGDVICRGCLEQNFDSLGICNHSNFATFHCRDKVCKVALGCTPEFRVHQYSNNPAKTVHWADQQAITKKGPKLDLEVLKKRLAHILSGVARDQYIQDFHSGSPPFYSTN